MVGKVEYLFFNLGVLKDFRIFGGEVKIFKIRKSGGFFGEDKIEGFWT